MVFYILTITWRDSAVYLIRMLDEKTTKRNLLNTSLFLRIA